MSRMHKSVILLGAAAFALLAGGCEKPGKPNGKVDPGSTDISAIRDVIAADQDRWNKEYHATPKNADTLAAHYAPDANIVAAGTNPISGSSNIRALFNIIAADPNFDMTFDNERIDVARSGDFAYARGRFTDRFTDPASNQVRSERGSFLTIYKKQDDGSWRVVEDFTAADAAPQPVPK
jgi:uncharacterized protein (TIGR02246 family)